MEARAAPESPGSPLERIVADDFLATGDPALSEAADDGRIELLGYRELYELWERQQWATQDLDFSRDRRDWHERISEQERTMRLYGLSAFFLGEQRVTDELGPIMRAAETEEQRIFLSTQIADEARHVAFFDRFFREVGILDGADELGERLELTGRNVNRAFTLLFDEMLAGRVDRLASDPADTVCLVECVTIYHMIVEGILALTGQHTIISYNEREGTLPGFVEGFRNVARDEHRHVAFGTKFLAEYAHREQRYRDAIQATLAETLPVADKVLDPPYVEPGEDWDLFGVTKQQTHDFAAQCLSRRLKVMGLA